MAYTAKIASKKCTLSERDVRSIPFDERRHVKSLGCVTISSGCFAAFCVTPGYFVRHFREYAAALGLVTS